jgi:superfamily II DNA/RNA helicase
MKLVDTSKLVKDSVKGDFTEKSQFDAFNDKKIFDGLIESYKQKAIGKKTIVFCPNIEMTHIVAKQLEVVNPNTYYVTSKSVSHGDRANTLAEYHASSDGIMVNCGILTTGYDHPAIECVILFRATDSIPLFFQMIGRASRPYQGKSTMTVIDMGENVERIGFWSDSKDWTDIFWNPPKKGNPKPPPMKNCPKCDAMMHVRVMECNYCGHTFKSKKRELFEGVLVEVKSAVNKKLHDLSVNELIKLEKSKIFSPEYVARILRSRHNGYYDLVTYAQMTNKKQGFITLQMKLPKGVRNIEITPEYIQEKISNVQS